MDKYRPLTENEIEAAEYVLGNNIPQKNLEQAILVLQVVRILEGK